MQAYQKNKLRRAQRVRTKLRKVADGKARLSVTRSTKHISVQLIDDAKGVTVAAASSLEKDFKGGTKSEDASVVGKLIADRAKKAGVTDVVFDRGGYIFHGRVKALAEAAREGGLKF
ncbi:MAG: 50S ribosomal protein L18 [Alphaproteobacteria bacterium]|jgi:large subunit ribosomal protein L18|nr:MAG: 50S ribosomal protein L18 [Alphaproteobacteria bacterium]